MTDPRDSGIDFRILFSRFGIHRLQNSRNYYFLSFLFSMDKWSILIFKIKLFDQKG